MFPSHFLASYSSRRGKLPQIFPSHQNDVIALQGVLELRAGHRVEVALPPSRAIRLMAHRDGFEFRIIVAGVNDEVVKTGLEQIKRLDVGFRPLVGGHVRIEPHN